MLFILLLINKPMVDSITQLLGAGHLSPKLPISTEKSFTEFLYKKEFNSGNEAPLFQGRNVWQVCGKGLGSADKGSDGRDLEP